MEPPEPQDPTAAYKRSLMRMKVRARERKHWSIVKKTIKIWEEMCRQGIDCTLVDGYACWGPAGCWHLWIEDSSGNQYDLGQSISGIKVNLVTDLPEGTKRVGTEHDGCDEYKIYMEDPKKYWQS
jgi:hypothetical protein